MSSPRGPPDVLNLEARDTPPPPVSLQTQPALSGVSLATIPGPALLGLTLHPALRKPHPVAQPHARWTASRAP